VSRALDVACDFNVYSTEHRFLLMPPFLCVLIISLCSGTQNNLGCAAIESGALTFNSVANAGWGWPLTCGTWKAHIVASSSSADDYTAAVSSAEFVIAGNPQCPDNVGVCDVANIPVSSTSHFPPSDSMQISNVAFSSCFKPSRQINNVLWKHVRDNFGSLSVWNWLGDNIYADTTSMQTKRIAYNNARDDIYYSNYGPVAEPKIPTTGTWDDHDYAENNMGKHYECRLQSQNEFVNHFGVPLTDPRHPSYTGGNQQEGIYSQYMFHKPGTGENGIHLINLDVRFHRSPTFDAYGPCEGDVSTMLGDTQWTWLENELSKPSEIKVIASGIQVLPPTNQDRAVGTYCAYDGVNNTFENANLDLNEGPGVSGTHYETWGELPQERTKLLQLCQNSVNAGNTKQIIFLSGDQHWAELMVKTVPARNGQAAVRIYEVTASGIDQSWNANVDNSNRVRPAATSEYPASDLPAGATTSSSNERTCSGDAMHVCSAQANYGAVEVDWNSGKIDLSIYTPHETTPLVRGLLSSTSK
jgi:hypothetical protein